MADANHKTQPFVTERFVTIQESQRYRRKWRTATGKYIEPTFYPWIKLAGRWIEHAGFSPGQRVRIAVEEGRLTITAS
ncbi:SymE family type I addiction module toxin [Burkholderia guangdongensis]|uniref:SymE family type I addiction module toxin n=1 Tax=Burkholderia guangdongensis TaxID=1792500 RepID=UPI0015C95C79|nr:SymE family type I addiction module toxin [Burkholderia guangdongensis]